MVHIAIANGTEDTVSHIDIDDTLGGVLASLDDIADVDIMTATHDGTNARVTVESELTSDDILEDITDNR